MPNAALLRQYRDACQVLPELDEPILTQYTECLEAVCDEAAEVGYGVQDAMNELYTEALLQLPDFPVEARVPMLGEDL